MRAEACFELLKARQDGASGDRAPEAALAEERRAEREKVVRCRHCDHPLAKSTDRVARGASHVHVCVNPSGIPYEIGCFSRAAGATEIGPREAFWSWFNGYAWRVMVCTECRAHVGWSFRGTDDAFVGLITSRVYESGEP